MRADKNNQNSDEFETQFHYAVQQKNPNHLTTQDIETKKKEEKSEVDIERLIGSEDKPFYKRHPIVFWIIFGAVITMAGNLYKKHKIENLSQSTAVINHSFESKK